MKTRPLTVRLFGISPKLLLGELATVPLELCSVMSETRLGVVPTGVAVPAVPVPVMLPAVVMPLLVLAGWVGSSTEYVPAARPPNE